MLQYCEKQAKTSYYIQGADINISSLEELNYVLYNHMNLIYRDFFGESLFGYIEKDLAQPGLAGKLRTLEKSGASLKDLIMCVFRESCYYGPNDLARINPLLQNINNMSRQERKIMEAENCLRRGSYETALKIYSDVLGRMDEEKLSERVYAKVAFSMGIIYARLFMSKNANACFSRAYDLYPDPAYAKACVYMSVINHDDEELLRAIIKYKISNEALAAIKKRVENMRSSVLADPEATEFIKSFRADPDAVIDKWKQEYYELLN